MAKVNKSPLGKISGSVGDVTFRQRSGKSFVGIRPVSFIPGSDAASIARRGKFLLAIKLASEINSISFLKDFWEISTPSGITVCNNITRKNYQLIGSGELTGTIDLVPSIGFEAGIPAVTLSSNNISVNIDSLGASTGIDLQVEKTVKLASVLYFDQPLDGKSEKNSFMHLVSESKTLVLDAAISFTVPLSNKESQLYSMYSGHKGFFVLVTFDAGGNPVNYSNTFAG